MFRLTFVFFILSLPLNAERPLIAYECPECKHLDKIETRYDWLIKPTPIKHEKPLQRRSKSYRIQADAQQLSQGITFTTQGNQAIIRVDGTDKHFLPTEWELITPSKQKLNIVDASKHLSNNQDFNSNPFFRHTQFAFQLKPELSHGQFILRSKTPLESKNSHFAIHVFDKYASTELNVQTDKINYFYGDKLTLDIGVIDDKISYPLIKITATLISPDGKKYPLSLDKLSHNHYQAHTQINSLINTAGENWYARIDTQSLAGEQIIYRHATTAFSYAIPSANITSVSLNPDDDESITYQATLNVSTESRYSVEGILYGHDDKHNLKPMMIAQSAAMLTPGTHQLTLKFNQEKFEQSTLHQPYELKKLRVIDYGQFKQVTP